jgi:hypothetical protein
MPEITGVELEDLRARAAQADDLRRQVANLKEQNARLLDQSRLAEVLVEQVAFLRGLCDSLRKMVEGMAARVVGQSELLSRRAEGPAPKPDDWEPTVRLPPQSPGPPGVGHD